MEQIFEGAIQQRIVAMDGTYANSSFVAEFSLDTPEAKRRGYLYAYARIGGLDAEVSRVALISGRTLAFEPPTQFGPVSLRVQILDTEPLPQSLVLWRVEGTDGGSHEESGPSSDGVLAGNLMELEPLPSGEGITIAPGRAVFEAGAVAKGWNTERDFYTLSTTVTDLEFWKIGFRSTETFSRGRIRFGSGVGPSVLGLAPQFNQVDFELTQWGFYIASSTEVRIFEFREGAIANVAQFPWTPARDLAIRIDGAQVYYEMLVGDDWHTLFSSNHPFTAECHFVGTLGPQAFVFNVQYEEL